VEVAVRGQILGRGKGESRREAERAAARGALAYLRVNHKMLRPYPG
jgi:dsRNA-specific ribonuclease